LNADKNTPSTSIINRFDVQLERFVERFIMGERPGLLISAVVWSILVFLYIALASSDIEPWYNNLHTLVSSINLNVDFWIQFGVFFVLWPTSVLISQLLASYFRLRASLLTVLRVTGRVWILYLVLYTVFAITTVAFASIAPGESWFITSLVKSWHGLGQICQFLVLAVWFVAIKNIYSANDDQASRLTSLLS
jgi:hypothetical protein